MQSYSYISRTLQINGKNFSEEAALAAGGVLVVLAEPGAGKTELLNSLALRLGVTRKRATIFRHLQAVPTLALVIDGFDEVAKIDQSAIDALIAKASESNATNVVFSSRSSEWDDSRTRIVKECFGENVVVARLQAFDEREQSLLFRDYLPEGNFEAFIAEARRFELQGLLANPQFLKLFADAYVESKGIFHSKQQIFSDAIKRLAQEDATRGPSILRPTSETIIAFAEEIFAKLLLSGATGVALAEAVSSRDFPHLYSLSRIDAQKLAYLPDTRLFKLAQDDLHEPVHRIVAEYCAAGYLSRRISDPSDRLSLKRCLAIVAPNGTVRDELRGLLGWLAALGSKEIQEAAIDLDPYGVLANGDPSQLQASSKRRLIRKLAELSKIDPYFRGGDYWRSFSCAGFFTAEVISEIRVLLTQDRGHGQLTDLLLELLAGSEAVSLLTDELSNLFHDRRNSFNTRHLVMDCLRCLDEWNFTGDLSSFLESPGPDELRLAARLVRHKGVSHFGRPKTLELFQRLAEANCHLRARQHRVIETKTFVNTLVKTIPEEDVKWLLDNLTKDISCSCAPKRSWRCECRHGISNTVGALLDHYIEVANEPPTADRIWPWIRDLRFKKRLTVDRSPSVALLQENSPLRQAIQQMAVAGLNVREEIWEARVGIFQLGHAGLGLQPEDFAVMVDHAYEIDNVALWCSFMISPSIYDRQEWHTSLRRRARAQSRTKREFSRAWASQQRGWLNHRHEERDGLSRAQSRYIRRQERIRLSNSLHLAENIVEIESGKDNWWIRKFAEYYLLQPEKIHEIVDDIKLPERALCNFLKVYSGPFPELEELVDGRWQTTSRVFFASCLARFRSNPDLSDIDTRILRVVKAVAWTIDDDKNESAAFDNELNRLLFPETRAIEEFARSLIEVQLNLHGNAPTDVGWLEFKPLFNPLRATLPIEWIERHPAMPLNALTTLFQMTIAHTDLNRVRKVILLRCCEYFAFWPERSEDADLEAKRDFWLLCHFFFSKEPMEYVWSWLAASPRNVFLFERKAGALSRDSARGWPSLTAPKIYRILDGFFQAWPAVSLPDSFGSDSPQSETAFRFLLNLLPSMDKSPHQENIAILDNIIADDRFALLRDTALNLKAEQARALSLRDFQAPLPSDVVRHLELGEIANVEDLRALLVEMAEALQIRLKGAPTDPLAIFYDNGIHVGENDATKRMVDLLVERFHALNLSVNIEHHMSNSKRCDITITKSIAGKEHLLVVEAKGQWHPDLYTAASAQLFQRYSIHPGAALQGIYLVYWFGKDVDIAGTKTNGISTSMGLRQSIIESMPIELLKSVDVVVIDLER